MPDKPEIGKVFLVGAGPGDYGLITLKATECLKCATVVIYDYLVNEEILNLAPPEAELIFAGKKWQEKTLSQDEINQLLYEKALAGHIVVRLKGGDPFLFGRGGEEAMFLTARGVPIEIVPGVTSAIAAPAYAGIPVTHRDLSSSVHIFTAHKRDTPAGVLELDWHTISRLEGTFIFLMGMANLPQLVENLLKYGKNPTPPVAIIRNGTLPEQETLVSTLEKVVEDARRKNLQPPVVIVIGECVKLREALNWLESQPLFGKRILITRPEEQGEEFARLVSAYGGTPLVAPTITIMPIKDNKPLYDVIEHLSDFDWLLFASANSVKIFMQELYNCGKDVRWLGKIKIATIGTNTARLLKEKWGICPDFVPSQFVQEKMAEELPVNRGCKVLIPRAATSRDVLPVVLRQKGVEVEVIPVYEIVPDKAGIARAISLFQQKKVDVVVFTASSTVKFLMDNIPPAEYQQLFTDVVIASIGPITTETIKSYSLSVHIETPEYTTDALLKAIIQYFKK